MTAAALDAAAAKKRAEETVRKSRTSFAAGMAILPKKRREAMHAIYAFCREVDDIADGDLPKLEKRRKLAEWRDEIDRLYAGAPRFPIGMALVEPVAEFAPAKAEFIAVIEGMEMDADGPIVAPTFERLFAYTRRVAGAVGMLSMPVFGAPKGEASDRFALSLGDALQLTNILRDVGDDARIGRLYLPLELLDRHGAPKDAGAILRSSALASVANDLGEVAAQKFADARAALCDLDWRVLRPALLMMGVYEAYLSKLERRGWDKIGQSISIPPVEKMFIAARYALAPPLVPLSREGFRRSHP